MGIEFWIIFNVFVVGMLVLDLYVFHKREHEIKLREALGWTAFWIGLALAFNVAIYFWKGQDFALEFLTGFLVEKALSVDNLFVFLAVFSYFRVPASLQHKVLFWGILGALIFRAIFIFLGIEILERFEWVIYFLGGFLVFLGLRMIFSSQDEDIDPGANPMIKLLRKLVPVTPEYHDDKFFIRQSGKLFATPLFVVLIVIETTDIVFAVDSIPAILAISTHDFIVYTSNIFAILGLRALYFALASVMHLFHYLKYGLSIVLVFIGVKILLGFFDYHLDTKWALIAVLGFLTISVVASLLFPQREKDEEHLQQLAETKEDLVDLEGKLETDVAPKEDQAPEEGEAAKPKES